MARLTTACAAGMMFKEGSRYRFQPIQKAKRPLAFLRSRLVATHIRHVKEAGWRWIYTKGDMYNATILGLNPRPWWYLWYPDRGVKTGFRARVLVGDIVNAWSMKAFRGFFDDTYTYNWPSFRAQRDSWSRLKLVFRPQCANRLGQMQSHMQAPVWAAWHRDFFSYYMMIPCATQFITGWHRVVILDILDWYSFERHIWEQWGEFANQKQ